jgi:hypothetical protein
MNCYCCEQLIRYDDNTWDIQGHSMPYSWCTSPAREPPRHSDTQVSIEYMYSAGIQILCNSCWLDLWTPQKRWLYYDRWALNNNLPASQFFTIEQNVYEDYTYDEKLILAVGSIVLDKSSNEVCVVDGIHNFTVTIVHFPTQLFGRRTYAKSAFDSLLHPDRYGSTIIRASL